MIHFNGKFFLPARQAQAMEYDEWIIEFYGNSKKRYKLLVSWYPPLNGNCNPFQLSSEVKSGVKTSSFSTLHF
jgi:hypothetical protein